MSRNNHEQAKKLCFGSDLIKQSKIQIDFLKNVKGFTELRKPEVLKRALYRYEQYWLPLAANSNEKVPLSAPIDIEWIWHCHMLAPRSYERDCQTLVGRTVDHVLRNQKDTSANHKIAINLWNQRYGNEEPFNIDFNGPYDYSKTDKFTSSLSYDVISATKRQAEFYYQVSLPHFKCAMFLENALLRYKKFLYLKSKLPKDFLVPCYDIDLIWHSHLLNPLTYKQDTEKILGALFNHDDAVSERNAESTGSDSSLFTNTKWKECYDEQFLQNGTLYRGKADNSMLYTMTQDDVRNVSDKTWLVTIEKLELHLPEITSGSDYKITYSTYDKRGLQNRRLFAVKPVLDEETSVMSCTGAWHVEISTGTRVVFTLKENNKVLCFNSFTSIGKADVDLLSSLTDNGELVHGSEFRSIADIGNGHKIHVYGSTSIQKSCKFTTFYLQQGEYADANIPTSIKDFMGPVPLDKLPPNVDNKCQMATHRLTDVSGNEKFTIRMIHSQPLLLSVIQVFYHDNIVANGHLMMSNQLPLPPTEGSSEWAGLNSKIGQRAILIKNEKGDWGIVTGKWRGFQMGHSKGACVRGHAGTLVVDIFKLTTGRKTSVELRYPEKIFNIELDRTEADLMNGKIVVNTPFDEVAENIVLAFSVALLHVLCVPRPEGWTKGQQVKPSAAFRGLRKIEAVPSDDMALILAAGLLTDSPSNHFITSYYGQVTNNNPDADGTAVGGADTLYDENGKPFEASDGDNLKLTICGGCGGCYGSTTYTPSYDTSTAIYGAGTCDCEGDHA